MALPHLNPASSQVFGGHGSGKESSPDMEQFLNTHMNEKDTMDLENALDSDEVDKK
jgi:hypothetical protein